MIRPAFCAACVLLFASFANGQPRPEAGSPFGPKPLPPAWPASAQSPTLFAFGDSYTDSGSGYILSDGTVPAVSNGYTYLGRTTNKKTYIEMLKFDGDGRRNNLTLYNGATYAASANEAPPGFPQGISFRVPTLVQQVHKAREDWPTPPPGSTAMIWIGANDIVFTFQMLGEQFGTPAFFDGMQQTADRVVETIFQTAAEMIEAGWISNVVISNLQPMHSNPVFRYNFPDPDTYSAVTDYLETHIRGINANIRTRAAALASESRDDATVVVFDAFSTFQDVIANPGLFGFTNVTDSCLISDPPTLPSELPFVTIGSTCERADEYVFWDSSHPTSQMHKILANTLRPLIQTATSLLDLRKPLRVRKELRHLTDDEYIMFIQGLGVMQSINTQAGKAIFGPMYRSADYFVVKHAVNAQFPYNSANIGNVAHFGPWFFTWHRGFGLEFENALLSIVPSLLACPYWEIYEDFGPGHYYETDNWMYGPRWMGNKTGNPDYDYAVLDGPFGGKMVSRFNYEEFADVAPYYNGSALGFLRDVNNMLNTTHVTRYPANWLAQQGIPYVPGIGDFPYYYNISEGPGWNFTFKEFERCANVSHVHDMWDLQMCIEFPTTLLQWGWKSERRDFWLNDQGLSPWIHAMFHSMTGSLRLPDEPPGPPFGSFPDDCVDVHLCTGNIQGDARDLATSPNELMAFMADHIALDRLFMIWEQRRNMDDPTQADTTTVWGYPRESSPDWERPPGCPPGSPGCDNPFALPTTANGGLLVLPHCGLHDEMSPWMPFTNIFDWPTPNGVTHYDILTYQPDYTYETLTIEALRS